jgi:hypothetical protein
MSGILNGLFIPSARASKKSIEVAYLLLMPVAAWSAALRSSLHQFHLLQLFVAMPHTLLTNFFGGRSSVLAPHVKSTDPSPN